MIGNPRFWNLVKVVSAFTLAHSLTLALAWYGIVELPARLTESLIALTIAYVAAENLWRRRPVERWPLAFGLGLVHGLGFYSALAGIELAREHALTTLLAFNLGVELGQLAIMAAFFVLLFRLIGSAWYGQAVRFASAAILAVAVYWAALRAFVA